VKHEIEDKHAHHELKFRVKDSDYMATGGIVEVCHVIHKYGQCRARVGRRHVDDEGLARRIDIRQCALCTNEPTTSFFHPMPERVPWSRGTVIFHVGFFVTFKLLRFVEMIIRQKEVSTSFFASS
tara:strand:+ start:333 stop:707 length:375 start_codon:yes stop_codon:yes gene_type:complete